MRSKLITAVRGVVVPASVSSTLLLSTLTPVGAALSGSDFQAGNIISQAVFTNYNSMGVQDIQNFLNAKVPTCDTNGTQQSSHAKPGGGYYTRAEWGNAYNLAYNTNIAAAPYVCLKNYIENPATKQNNIQNPNVPVAGGQTAAQLIYNAAQTYHINPQVFIVTLQKEQGLVTDDWPWANEYSAAMGYACPDDGTGCHSTYAGFATQIDNAGWQFRNYLDSPNKYNFNIGNNFILYNTTSSGCSANGSVVAIQNLSTAALYDYTPYQPNANVLANTQSTSNDGAGSVSNDNCAAYGNRNFWWYFTKWFGSTQTTTAYAWNFYNKEVYADAAYTQPYYLADGVLAMKPGSKAYIRIRAVNNGNQTWTPSTVRMGTSNPKDRCSVFSDASWLACYRITLKEPSVAPGEVGTFEFSVTAPNQTGGYREYFNLLAEGITWMNDPLYYLPIDVVSSTAPVNAQYLGLTSDQSLTPNQYLMSPDAHSILLMQGDGNLVLYTDFVPTWSSRTSGTGANKLLMQGDGNLVLYKGTIAVWSSRTNVNFGASLSMKTDGSFTISNAAGQQLWTNGTAVTPDFLTNIKRSLPGNGLIYPQQVMTTQDRKHQLILQRDGNLVLYSSGRAIWASNTSGSQVAYGFMQLDGNLVLYSQSGRAIWASNTSGAWGSNLTVQGDGNLVIYNPSNYPVWSTGTFGK